MKTLGGKTSFVFGAKNILELSWYMIELIWWFFHVLQCVESIEIVGVILGIVENLRVLLCQNWIDILIIKMVWHY